jgi:hypothetical protein
MCGDFDQNSGEAQLVHSQKRLLLAIQFPPSDNPSIRVRLRLPKSAGIAVQQKAPILGRGASL